MDSLLHFLQNDAVIQQLAAIFSHSYGPAPLPAVPEIKATLSAQLGKNSISDHCIHSLVSQSAGLIALH